MPINSIFMPIFNPDRSLSTLSFCLAFAEKLGAHVDAVLMNSPRAVITPAIGESFSPAMLEQVTSGDPGDRLDETKKLIHNLAEKYGLKETTYPIAPKKKIFASVSFSVDPSIPEVAIRRRGTLSDLIVLPQPAEDSIDEDYFLIQSSLLDSGAGILIVPPAPPATFAKKGAMLWRGKTENLHCIRSARPLWSHIDDLIILVPEPFQKDEEKDAISNYFATHGVKTVFEDLEGDLSPKETIGDVVEMYKKKDIDMLFMPAYTHGLLQRLVIGSYTQEVLKQTTIPVFLAH